ncbi:MAG: DNA primase [Clostridium sulfidigenes]|uniref:DNA primase n=1 Tax=Clostridium sulfidigenes TaxID=318464 RepID=A0A927W4Y8_9CLOT|nr:DNA primase [Clostridium sulfidigenes]
MFSEEIIQKIKEENDIVDIVSEVVTLKKTGKNYLGRCPFHNEKTPSFTVSSEKQIYKCFGCGEAGNVISFVMKTRNMAFPEAVKLLGEKVGIVVDDADSPGKSSAANEKFKRMYDINIQAARYFYTNLKRFKAPYEYLKGRGITDETIKKFGIGFSLDNWQGIRSYLKQRGFSEEEILELGLTTKNEKGNIYDRFRNRIIFPVFNVSGRVIGFGGRVLDDSKPKYLNSPETPIFHKGTNLYGLNLAIKNNQARTVIMVEGYMDVISLSQQGVTNVVATLGTALTEGQCKLLKRYIDTVIVSFDSDVAGQNATIRGLEILQKSGFDLKILQIPSGKDPDEFIRSFGREKFLNLVDGALPIIDFKLRMAEKGIDFSKQEMVIKYLKRVVSVLKDLDPLEKAVYIKQVSEKSGIGEEAIMESLDKNPNKSIENNKNHNINRKFGQKLYLEPGFVRAERTVLSLALDKRLSDKIFSNISEDDLILKAHKVIYTIIKENNMCSKEELIKIINLQTMQDSEFTKEWIKIQEYKVDIDEGSIDKMVSDCVNNIKKYKLEESRRKIMDKIRKCESEGLVEETLMLARELMDIQKEMGKL